MVPDDPRIIDGWNELGEPNVPALSPIQLIAFVHHNLRQKIAVTAGLGQLLAQGMFGFVSQEQQNGIEQLQANIRAIKQIHQDIDRWLVARIDQDGNWLSDEHGSLPQEKP